MDCSSLNEKEYEPNNHFGEMQGEILYNIFFNNPNKDEIEAENEFNKKNPVYYIQSLQPEEKNNSVSEMDEQSNTLMTQYNNIIQIYSKEPDVRVIHMPNKKIEKEKKTEKTEKKTEKTEKETEKIMEKKIETEKEIEDGIEECKEIEKENGIEEELLDRVIEEENPEDTMSGGNEKKERDDNKRKRIKSNFCKYLIIALNEILKLVDPYFYFENISQYEVTDVSIKENKKIWNFTLKEFLSYKVFENIPHTKLKNKKKEIKREIERERNKKEWEHNIKILNLLEEKGNKIIDEILKEKMKDIYKQYLVSEVFQKSIEELRGEGKYYDFIHDYLTLAKNLLKYYEV